MVILHLKGSTMYLPWNIQIVAWNEGLVVEVDLESYWLEGKVDGDAQNKVISARGVLLCNDIGWKIAYIKAVNVNCMHLTICVHVQCVFINGCMNTPCVYMCQIVYFFPTCILLHISSRHNHIFLQLQIDVCILYTQTYILTTYTH